MAIFNSISTPNVAPAVYAKSTTVSQASSSTSEVALMTVTLSGISLVESPIRPIMMGLQSDTALSQGGVVITTTNGGSGTQGWFVCRDQNSRLIGRISFGWFPGGTPTGTATYQTPNTLYRWVDFAPTATTMSYTVYMVLIGNGAAGQISSLYAWALQKGV